MADNKNKLKHTIILAFVFFLFAYYYSDLKLFISNLNTFSNSNSSHSNFESINEFELKQNIVKSWKNLILFPYRNNLGERNLRISIGMNTNVDLILSGTELFEMLNLTDETNNSKQHEHLNNMSQFKECFKYFFSKGSAAERSFNNLNDFNRVLSASDKINKKKWFIGGNAALMAETISNSFPNIDILLIGPVGPKLRELLNPNIKTASESLIEKDEVHLILEYGLNESFEESNAPAANRFIVSHDIFNSQMQMMNNFFSASRSYQPDIMILAGLHLLESQNHTTRNEKLQQLQNQLTNNFFSKCAIHLELASIGDKTLMKSIVEIGILNKISSLGLNEQELLFFSYVSDSAPHNNYFNELKGQPELGRIIDILEWILNSYGKLSQVSSSLSRIHFHCLSFHLIAILDTNEWSNTVSSLMAGAKIASKQACGLELNNEKNEKDLHEYVDLRISYQLNEKGNFLFKIDEKNFVEFNSSNPVVELTRGRIKFYFTPVLVCKSPVKTVGLGDAISSTGLLYSSFNFE